MAFDDDADPTNGSQDESEDDDMEDVNDTQVDEDGDADMDQNGDDDEEDDNDDNDEDDEDDEDQNEESPSRGARQQHTTSKPSPGHDASQPNPDFVVTSPSPRTSSAARSPGLASYIPRTRQEALTAQAYDIVPTMAAPQSTSINAIAATPDMRWVFSGGTDGYVRMYNWVETANGKVPLTVAQKHPFVDSVMKAGSLVTYWENEEPVIRTPPQRGEDDNKWTSPVYSLAVQHQATWLLSGLESGGINLQTCRHQAGTRIATLREHTSAVSVLTLNQDETGLLSGSWDKAMHDWDLSTGRVKRSFWGSGGQISAIETRPLSSVPIPEISEPQPEGINGTFSSNNADKPAANGVLVDGSDRRSSKAEENGEEDAAGSPTGSLFGDPGDHGSLFGDDNEPGGVPGGNSFGDAADDDMFGEALATSLEQNDEDAPGENENGDANENTEPSVLNSGGPVQPPAVTTNTDTFMTDDNNTSPNTHLDATNPSTSDPPPSSAAHTAPNLPHPPASPTSHELPEPTDTTPPTNPTSLPQQSESTFLSASIDGVLRLWDRRIPNPVATIPVHPGTGPFCTGACWSPDGNWFYAGRRNCGVDEYSIHKLGSSGTKASKLGGVEPNRTFKFQAGSGPVYAVRGMPNGRHLVCASQDILRIYDLHNNSVLPTNNNFNAPLTASALPNKAPRSTIPFTIVPGHRGGVISALHIDPACNFMLSAAGNRGWEGVGTEVLLGYEIGVVGGGG
ncbi:hypothetical protein MBLNU230_g3182t1 [Neophaeotheca triangularis]